MNGPLIGRQFAAVASLFLMLSCSGQSTTAGPVQSPDAQMMLGDIVLRVDDFPDGFVKSAEGASIDLTEPFTKAPECKSIGIPDSDIAEGLVQGDVVERGDRESPPVTAAVTAATRVRDADVAEAMLDEFASKPGRTCFEAAMSPPGDVSISRDSTNVVTITNKGEAGSSVLVFVAADVTVVASLIIAIGEPLDTDLVDLVTAKLLERAA